MNTKELGFLAENIAARYLQGRGYEIVERNYRKPWGEIDLISKLGKIYVFVEVKANSQEFSGDFSPEIRANSDKLGKVIKTASLYLDREAGGPGVEWQVDVISVTFNSPKKTAKLRHFKNIAQDWQ